MLACEQYTIFLKKRKNKKREYGHEPFKNFSSDEKKSQLSIRNTILKYRKKKPLQKYSVTDVFVASSTKQDVFQIHKMYKQFLKISVRENHKAIKKFLCYVNIIQFFLLSEDIKKIKIFLESGTELLF